MGFQLGLVALLGFSLAYTLVGWALPLPLGESRIISPRAFHPTPFSFWVIVESVLLCLLAGTMRVAYHRWHSRRRPWAFRGVALAAPALGAVMAVSGSAEAVSAFPLTLSISYLVFLLIAPRIPWKEAPAPATGSALRTHVIDVCLFITASLIVIVAAAPGWFLTEFGADESRLSAGFNEVVLNGGVYALFGIPCLALVARLHALLTAGPERGTHSGDAAGPPSA